MKCKTVTETVVIKAYDGDRAKNLEGIADWIDEAFPQSMYTETTGRFHELRGYAEQLRIIAKEISNDTSV